MSSLPIPDGWSCLDAVLRYGEVRNAQGVKASEETYALIPKTVPPYRSTRHW